jgi:hypothetical protein
VHQRADGGVVEQGRAIGILWYEQPQDLDSIHIAPRLAGPETAVRGHIVIVVNMTPPPTAKTYRASR